MSWKKKSVASLNLRQFLVNEMAAEPGKVIGPHDTPISAIAFQYEWTLVTNPTDAFSRVEDGTVGCRQK